ncbi:MAG TPA: helix-turn-helix transcriptional regulator [Stellaceae bacterium]|nr:helix-turn-helix transcriptional regulator [Stellaceae bacterium]
MPQDQVRRQRRTAKEHGPDPVDLHVGQRLRLGRELAGRTQTGIGQDLGMSFQVVQKYEQGEIRVSASRLFQLAQLLQKPVAYFFEGLEAAASSAAAHATALAEHGFARREVEFVRAYRAIGNAEVQERLLSLVRDIAEKPPL